jgi:acetylglutamate/LysW-gamma-L-alpha-aminoadipate kinase
VIKIGGSILKTCFPQDFISDLKKLWENNNKIILVHGGAAEVTAVAEKMGKKQQFVVSPDGMRSRYTDKETMEIYTMVMAGKLNKQITASLEGYGIKAIGVCGVDGGLLRAERKKKLMIIDERGRKVIIDGGYTGKITKVNTESLHSLLESGFLPVVAPIALGDEFELLNVDSDRAAAYIAGTLKADSLILCTDVSGVLLNNKPIDRLTVEGAKGYLNQIGHGMKKKVYAAIETLGMGTKEVIITSGLAKEPITSAIRHEVGTLICR